MKDPTVAVGLALLAAAIVTYAWRGLGVLLSGRLSPESRLFDWVSCIAYALLAALVARMIILPVGPLTETALGDRLAATALCVGAFFLMRQSVFAGSLAGAGGLALFDWLGLFG